MYILGSDLKQESNFESLALTTPQPPPPADDSSGEQAELVEPVLILFHGTPVRDGEVREGGEGVKRECEGGEGVRRECESGEGVRRECEGGEVGEGVRRELEIGCIKTVAVKKVSVNPNTLILYDLSNYCTQNSGEFVVEPLPPSNPHSKCFSIEPTKVVCVCILFVCVYCLYVCVYNCLFVCIVCLCACIIVCLCVLFVCVHVQLFVCV